MRRDGDRARIAAMATAVRLTIELDSAAEPVAGRVWLRDGDSRRFVGYLELLAALEALRAVRINQGD